MNKFVSLLTQSPLLLTACNTAGAEPKRYLGVSCSELSTLQQSYSQYSRNADPFAASEYNFNKQFGAAKYDTNDIGNILTNGTPQQVKQEKDLNSIRAAYNLQGC